MQEKVTVKQVATHTHAWWSVGVKEENRVPEADIASKHEKTTHELNSPCSGLLYVNTLRHAHAPLGLVLIDTLVGTD